jgi:hypothetical protein
LTLIHLTNIIYYFTYNVYLNDQNSPFCAIAHTTIIYISRIPPWIMIAFSLDKLQGGAEKVSVKLLSINCQKVYIALHLEGVIYHSDRTFNSLSNDIKTRYYLLILAEIFKMILKQHAIKTSYSARSQNLKIDRVL